MDFAQNGIIFLLHGFSGLSSLRLKGLKTWPEMKHVLEKEEESAFGRRSATPVNTRPAGIGLWLGPNGTTATFVWKPTLVDVIFHKMLKRPKCSPEAQPVHLST